MKASDLKKALDLVKPGLARKEFLEQATSIIFQGGRIWTFNDEVAVSVRLDLGITGAVTAEPLYAFLAKLKPDSEIKVESEGNELKFSSGRNRAGIRMDPVVKLPLVEELTMPEEEEWSPLDASFLPGLHKVLFSASRSGHRPILTCVHITDSYVETCDQYRLTRCSVTGFPRDFAVVAKHLEKLEQYKPSECKFSDHWLQFHNEEGVSYFVRIVDGEYPSLEKFLEVEGLPIEFPMELELALEWASVVVDDAIKFNQRVEVALKKGAMVIRGEGKDGWAEETIRMKYNGEPVSFSAHPLFLKEMAGIARNTLVGNKRMKVEGDGFIHVVTLDSPKGKE